MTKIQEVAAALGVSVATVSRAMSGKPGVSDAVRARVRLLADELNYLPSRSASALATGRTLTIGVVTPYIARWYFGHLISAIESSFTAAGYDLLLYNVSSENARSRFFQTLPVRKRVDALVVLLLPDDNEAAALRTLGIPVATVGSQQEGFISVGIDDVRTAEVAVQHLINLGHRRIAMIGEGFGVVPLQFVAPVDRQIGYYNALRAADIDVNPELEQNGEFTMQGGEEAMNRLLAARERPTAVFAQSDEMAIGALRSIRRHGLSVPGDISIIGIDDHEMSGMVGLTTMAQSLPAMGSSLAQAILEHLENPAAEVSPHTELPTRLVVRETTGSVRTFATGSLQEDS
ncbi:MAG: LacI family DNA-binding transcriptional regulator [Microbacteriaceae bacterium]|nr:LacI family DNA-binding transcriptional regulator [Microbacteriaceae bacterium]